MGDDVPKAQNGPVSKPFDASDTAPRQPIDLPFERSTTSTAHNRGWVVQTSSGSAQRFHDLDPAVDTDHQIWIHRVRRPAVVFGSTQRTPDLAGPTYGWLGASVDVEVCRRRSGGGVVVVRPGDVWIDAIVPRRSPLHSDDVGRAFHWLGRTWLDALHSLPGTGRADDARLRLAQPPKGGRAAARPFFCFADAGHGEVLFARNKIVGISQRRTRTWTRLQSLFVASWVPDEVERLVDAAMAQLLNGRRRRSELGAPPHTAAEVSAGFPPDHTAFDVADDVVVDAVLQRLPLVADTTSSFSGTEPLT